LSEPKDLTLLFESHRTHLRAVAYRMLGSATEADDAVQEAWLRLNGPNTSEVANLGGWLTTVVARVCLDILRSRRREEALDAEVVDSIADSQSDPEQETLLADSVGVALLVGSTRFRQPNESPLCFTMCSIYRSTKLPQSWIAHQMQRGSLPVAPADECEAAREHPMLISRANELPLMLSWPRCVRVMSRDC
jgi:hypothetical protein